LQRDAQAQAGGVEVIRRVVVSFEGVFEGPEDSEVTARMPWDGQVDLIGAGVAGVVLVDALVTGRFDRG
jgi:hypothetical protein